VAAPLTAVAGVADPALTAPLIDIQQQGAVWPGFRIVAQAVTRSTLLLRVARDPKRSEPTRYGRPPRAWWFVGAEVGVSVVDVSASSLPVPRRPGPEAGHAGTQRNALGSGIFSPSGVASISAIVLGAVGIVICGVVRAAGRRLEPDLWKSWGGPPTTRALRWRESTNEAATQRLHARLNRALGRELPTQAEEASDPAEADLRYEEAVVALRGLTRDRSRFPLVAEEVADYGFRRNCLGLRPIALVIAAAVMVASVVVLSIGDDAQPARFILAAAVGAIALLGWTFGVRPRWVRSSADLYATRLLEAAETLGRDRP
jgi:hypothetical protein